MARGEAKARDVTALASEKFPLTLTARKRHGQHDSMNSSARPAARSRSLNAWLKTDDRTLASGIASGLTLLEIAEDLERDAVLVLRRLDTLGEFEFASGTEEWVEIMSMALSGIPLQDVVAWCTAAEERMPYELLDAMRSGPDMRSAFELARELRIEVHNEQAVADLQWLARMADHEAVDVATAAKRLADGYHGVTASAVRVEMLGLTPTGSPRGRAPTSRSKRTSTARRGKAAHGRSTTPSRAPSASRPRKTTSGTAGHMRTT